MRAAVPYYGGAYHAVPLAIVHPEGNEEDEEVGDVTTAAGPFQAPMASQQRRRVLADEVDEDEEEREQLIRPSLQRGGLQPPARPPTSGVVTRSATLGAEASRPAAAAPV